MIDWWGLVPNVLWVLGLALALAVFSVASYQAGAQGARLRDNLKQATYHVPLNLGLSFFCLGLLLSSRTWWEGVLWGLLAAGFAAQATVAWWQSRVDGRRLPQSEEADG